MDHSPLNVVQFFGGIFLLMGSAVGGRGVWRWWRWTHALGKVIDYVEAPGEEEGYYPKIRVMNHQGGPVEFVSAVGGGGKPWKIGAKVPVLFRRKENGGAEGEVVSWFFLWVFPAACLLVGGVLVCARVV